MVAVPLHQVEALPQHLFTFHGCGLGKLLDAEATRALLALTYPLVSGPPMREPHQAAQALLSVYLDGAAPRTVAQIARELYRQLAGEVSA